jgi:hypothetical protein
MTASSLAAVVSRIDQIQARLPYIESDRGFAAALDAATQATVSDVPAANKDGYVVDPQQQSATATLEPAPIGLLGTPVVLNPGTVINTYRTGTGADWVDVLPEGGRKWASAIRLAATDAGIDPRLLAAVVWQESGFDPDAVSRSGALGLAQLMPATADGLGVDPANPIENLEGGARYLAWTIREFGTIELGLAAYNAGPGSVRTANGIPDIPETQAYVPKVLDYYRMLGGEA